MAEFKKPYDKAYEFWHVTTEGDCEGRSTTDLGVFEENIKGAITMAEFKKPYDKAYGFWVERSAERDNHREKLLSAEILLIAAKLIY